jgi:Uma2 family endonuclease
MSSTLPPPIEDLAELLDRLGGIPANRVRLHPPPGTATEADVLKALEAPRKRICELIDGVLVEKPRGYPESILASYLIELLNAFVRPRNLGVITAPDGSVRLYRGLVRFPDVAYASWDRFPNRRRPKAQIPDLVPDLAIDVLSPSNTVREMERKRGDYFSVGVKLVWHIDPDSRTVETYTGPNTFTTLHEADSLTGDPVLPGFSIALGELFGELDRHG